MIVRWRDRLIYKEKNEIRQRKRGIKRDKEREREKKKKKEEEEEEKKKKKKKKKLREQFCFVHMSFKY